MTTSSRRYLVDSSVVARSRQPLIHEHLDALALGGKHRTCRVVDLEHLYSRRARDVARVASLRRALPEVPITPGTMDHAMEIMERLAAAGLHRAAKPADCVIAACALESGLAVLHYDSDFDRIAEVIGLEAEWVAPAGSLD